MPPLNLSTLEAFDEEQVEKQADAVFETLLQWEVVDDTDLPRIHKLTQMLQMSAEILVNKMGDELEDKKKELAVKQAEHDRAREDMTNTIDELTRSMKDKDDEHTKKINDITKRLNDLEDELASAKKERELLQRQANEAEHTRFNTEKRKTEHEEQRRELETVKDHLEKDNEELKNKLKAANDDIEGAAEDIKKFRLQIQQSDNALNELKALNQRLEYQISDLKQRVMSKTDDDDQIMGVVNKRIEEWKVLLGAKDAQIAELQRTAGELQQQLTLATADADRASVGMLTRALAERDDQIENLRKKMTEATRDIERHAGEMEHLRRITTQDKGGRDDPQVQLFEAQKKLKAAESMSKELEAKCKQAEDELFTKDKKIAESAERMAKYEAGYGLRDAIDEIKHWKEEVGKKEKQVIEMSRLANECEMQLNKLYDENEELRRKLGLDPAAPVDMTDYKAFAVQQRMSDRLLNQILQKEIELLESERAELKSKLRILANKIPKDARGAAISDELMHELRRPVSKVVEDIIRRDHPGVQLNNAPQSGRQTRAEVLEGGIEVSNLRRDLAEQADRLHVAGAELDALRLENGRLKQDVSNLTTALSDLDKVIRKQQGISNNNSNNISPGNQIECPALDRFVSAMEIRGLSGDDMSAWLRAELDRFHGRCAELREENRQLRQEAVSIVSANAKLTQEVNALRSELEESGAGIRFHRFKLPDSMAPSSAETIAALTDHLVNVLHETSVKEKLLSESQIALQDYKRQISVIRHQQSLVYEEYAKAKKSFDEQVKAAEAKVTKLEAARSEDAVKLDEFEKLLNLFSSVTAASNADDVDAQYRRHAVESTRRTTVARVTERRTALQLESADFDLAGVKRENERLRNDSIKLQVAITQRIGSLQRFKEAALFRVSFLQRQLDSAVPLSEYELLGKRLDEATMQYRELLERQQVMVDARRMADDLKVAVDSLRKESDTLKTELIAEKELKAGFQAVVEEYAAKGVLPDAQKALTTGHVQSISRKLAALEMKELNERERAEHAVRLHEQMKSVADQLEQRNRDLEHRFAEITKLNLDAQKIERDLRDELAHSVPRSVYEADRNRAAELEKSEVILKNEVHHLKEMRDVAVMQRKAVELRRGRVEAEVESLRGQIREFQAQSEERAMIVRLHGQLLQLQASEAFAVAQLEGSQQQIAGLEIELAKIERRLEDREHTLHFQRTESSNRIRQLRRTVHALRQQFIGSVPLSQQEKMTKTVLELEEAKRKIAEDLREASTRREMAEVELETTRLKQRGLEELLAGIKEGPAAAAQRLTEWHQKLEQLRLEDLRSRRLIMRLEDQVKVDESAIVRREQSIAVLEAELVAAKRELEMQQIEWEQREVYLEQVVNNMEKQLSEIASDALQFENEQQAMPDPSLSPMAQLDAAKQTIRSCVKGLLERGAENKMLRKKVDDAETRLRDAETGLLHQNRLISELRVRLPASEQAAAMTAAGTFSSSDDDGERPDADESGTTGQLRRQLRIARTSVESLKKRLEQKDETIRRFEQLVAQLRTDFERQQRNYEEEMRTLQARLSADRDMLAAEMNAALSAAGGQPLISAPTAEMITRLHELEDADRENRRVITELHERLHDAEQKVNRHRAESSATLGRIQNEMDQHRAQKEDERQKLLRELDNARRQVVAERAAVERLEAELALERQRGPTNAMKQLVEKLRAQINEKEKKSQALTKALADLRGELLSQAEAMAKQKTDDSVQSANIEKLVEKRTKELHAKQTAAENELTGAKQAAKQAKENEANLREELHRLKEELAKKGTQIAKLKSDKQHLEADIAELQRQLEHPIGHSERVAAGASVYDRPVSGRGDPANLRDQLRSKEAEVVQLTRANDILKATLERLGKERDEVGHQSSRPSGNNPLLERENMAMRLELDGLRKEVSRLREKNDDMEKYVDLLKTENSQLSGKGGSGLSAISGNVRRIGESGRSPADLEKTIALLKKVIDRLQAENEQLKQATDLVSNSEAGRLRVENRDLKDRIGELEQTVGQAVSERYSAVERGAAKLSNEYDKLRVELKREIEARQRADVAKEQLARELAEIKQQLAFVTTQQGDRRSASAVQQSSTNSELERQRGRVAELTQLLRDSTDREQRLNNDLQQAKSEIAKLKAELANFGPEFFEELENLKYSYSIVVREKKELEDRLKRAVAGK